MLSSEVSKISKKFFNFLDVRWHRKEMFTNSVEKHRLFAVVLSVVDSLVYRDL